MALAYIIDGGLNDPPGNGTELYDAYPVVRDLYAEVADCTGVPVPRLLSRELDRSGEHRQVGAIRHAAVVLGVCDVLAERGVRPEVVAGLSLGGMVGAAITGAVSRRELFGLLARLRDVPPAPGPPQGVASLFVPTGLTPQDFAGGFPPGVFVAAHMGLIAGGTVELVLISGHREALHKLAEKLPDKAAMRIPPDITTAYHSPLQHYISEWLEPSIESMDFRDPDIPLCGGLPPGRYSTAAQVREMFSRNHTDTVSLPLLYRQLDNFGVELSFLIGPAMVDLFVACAAHSVIHIENPDHIPEALSSFHEFGMRISTP
jgi:[acyl-carrier-protein] S-malonyltransferase